MILKIKIKVQVVFKRK